MKFFTVVFFFLEVRDVQRSVLSLLEREAAPVFTLTNRRLLEVLLAETRSIVPTQ